MKYDNMRYCCALCLLFPRLTAYQKMLLKFCIYADFGNPADLAAYHKYRVHVINHEAILRQYGALTRICSLIILATYTNYRTRDDDLDRTTMIIQTLTDLKINWNIDFWPEQPLFLVQEELSPITCKLIDTVSLNELPIIADSMEEALSKNYDIINHLRNGQKHYSGCWAYRVLKFLRDDNDLRRWNFNHD